MPVMTARRACAPTGPTVRPFPRGSRPEWLGDADGMSPVYALLSPARATASPHVTVNRASTLLIWSALGSKVGRRNPLEREASIAQGAANLSRCMLLPPRLK